jgi:hypothetical protein
MTSALSIFAVELWSVDADAAKMFEAMIKEVNAEAILNKNARALLRGCEWIAARTDRSIVERLEKMIKLGEFETPAVIGMRAWTGWH